MHDSFLKAKTNRLTAAAIGISSILAVITAIVLAVRQIVAAG